MYLRFNLLYTQERLWFHMTGYDSTWQAMIPHDRLWFHRTGHVGWQNKMDWKFRTQLARTGFIFQTFLFWRWFSDHVQSVNDVTEEGGLFLIRQEALQAVLGIRDISGPYLWLMDPDLVPDPAPDPDQTPDPTSFFIDFKDAKKCPHFFSLLAHMYIIFSLKVF